MVDNQRVPMEVQDERRRHHRYPLYLAATANLQNKRNNIKELFWVKNISVSGALIFSPQPLDLHSRLRLHLHLPWYKALTVESFVVRQHSFPSGKGVFGIQFQYNERPARIAINQTIKTAKRNSHLAKKSAILVISDQAQVREALDNNFILAGVQGVFLKTPLDTISWLQNKEIKIDTVIFDLGDGGFHALSLLKFIAREYPYIRVIALDNQPLRQLGQLVLASGLVDAVIETGDDLLNHL